MKHLSIPAAVILVLAAATVSCDKLKPPQPQLQPAPTVSGQAGQPAAVEDHQRFTQSSQKTLDELRDAIAGFKAKAETANVETKAKVNAGVEKLEAEFREVEQRMGELKSATVESWTQIKESFGKSLEKLKNSVERFGKESA